MAPITSCVGRSKVPKALSWSNHSLPQENPATVRGIKGDLSLREVNNTEIINILRSVDQIYSLRILYPILYFF